MSNHGEMDRATFKTMTVQRVMARPKRSIYLRYGKSETKELLPA